MNKPFWIWFGFFAVVIVLMIVDLGLFHRKNREIGVRESLWFSLGYVLVSVCFGFLVCHYLGSRPGKNFFTGYFIEKSLSLDNIMIISMVFTHFSIPRSYQHRVLFWGIMGVLILRGLMIGLGAMLIERFHWILFLFGAFLIFTGIRMFFLGEKEEKTLEENKILAWLRKSVPVTSSLYGKKFFAREAGKVPGTIVRKATPLFLVLLFIELADIVFALDSVPAVFAITTDPFIVYTSNIFAVLGLRALYFALAAMLHRFAYLKYALALVLVFIGSKIFIAPVFTIPSGWSLFITLLLLSGGILFSLHKTRASYKKAAPETGAAS